MMNLDSSVLVFDSVDADEKPILFFDRELSDVLKLQLCYSLTTNQITRIAFFFSEDTAFMDKRELIKKLLNEDTFKQKITLEILDKVKIFQDYVESIPNMDFAAKLLSITLLTVYYSTPQMISFPWRFEESCDVADDFIKQLLVLRQISFSECFAGVYPKPFLALSGNIISP